MLNFLIASIILLSSIAQLSAGESPHGALKISCESCHVATGWDKLKAPLDFDHNRQTSFELTGRHLSVGCTDCHRNLKFSSASAECHDCHSDIHSGQFAAACSDCHTPDGWLDPAAMQRYHSITRFPLVGVHAELDCQSCHAAGRYADLPLECIGCHRTSYESSNNPDHRAARFSINCLDCHKLTSGWQTAVYQHPSGFSLTRAHSIHDCAVCHAGQSKYSDASSVCYSCHQSNYEAITNPNHVASGFDHDCAVCHSMDGWTPAQFDHDSTGFALVGAHKQVDCNDCHANGFNNTPTACFSCHEGDYNGVADPSHSAGQFDHDCAVCHSMDGWTPAQFDHDSTDFPLTGAHRQVDCNDCHANGFSNTPTDCYFCHENDYNDVNDPDHSGAGFPHNCVLCHNTNRWDDVNYDHDGRWFPIYGGGHREAWDRCSDCHTNANNFSIFACINCHEHNRQEMDDKHNEVRNYQYNSSACYNCHPRGVADDGLRRLRLPLDKMDKE